MVQEKRKKKNKKKEKMQKENKKKKEKEKEKASRILPQRQKSDCASTCMQVAIEFGHLQTFR